MFVVDYNNMFPLSIRHNRALHEYSIQIYKLPLEISIEFHCIKNMPILSQKEPQLIENNHNI